MIGACKYSGALYISILLMVGEAFASRCMRILEVFVSGNRNILLYPIVVWESNNCHFPSRNASMLNDLTRCPNRIYSCINNLLNVIGALAGSMVIVAWVILSSVAQ